MATSGRHPPRDGAPPPASSLLRRALGRDPVVAVMALALPLVKVLQVASVRPTLFPDSPTYRREGHWLDFSLTSLDGHSVRPVGVTAWMALWPGDRALMFGQALLSALAWAALALVVARGIRHHTPRRLTAAALVLIPCTAQIANWDTIVLGDSAAMSTGILALAALILLVRRPTWSRALVFAPIALWYTMTRPNLFVVVLAWAVSLLLTALLLRKVLVLGTVALALVVFSGYSYVYNLRADAAWTESVGISRSTVAMAYPMGPFNPVAPEVLRDLRTSGAPACMIPAKPSDVSGGGTTRWVRRTAAKCPGMNAWATEHWQHWWIGWLASHPGSALRIIDRELPNSLSPSIWGTVVAAAPAPVADLFFGTPARPQDAHVTRDYRIQPLILWLVAAGALALVATSRRLWRRTAWGVDLALLATVGGGLASAISSGLLIQTVAHEVSQESLGATAVLTAAVVAAVGLGWDRVLTAVPPPRR